MILTVDGQINHFVLSVIGQWMLDRVQIGIQLNLKV
jgi:hypothetical protein